VLQIHSPYQGSVDAEHALIDTIRQATGNRAEIWRAVSMTGPTGTAGTANQPGESDQAGPASQAEAGQEWARAVADRVDKLVLDAGDGGSGTSFNWETIPAELAGKTLLAGGIHPQNLAEALPRGRLGWTSTRGLNTRRGRRTPGRLIALLILSAHTIRMIRGHKEGR
jgi:tryptophan biosynthesis protein trpCF